MPPLHLPPRAVAALRSPPSTGCLVSLLSSILSRQSVRARCFTHSLHILSFALSASLFVFSHFHITPLLSALPSLSSRLLATSCSPAFLHASLTSATACCRCCTAAATAISIRFAACPSCRAVGTGISPATILRTASPSSPVHASFFPSARLAIPAMFLVAACIPPSPCPPPCCRPARPPSRPFFCLVLRFLACVSLATALTASVILRCRCASPSSTLHSPHITCCAVASFAVSPAGPFHALLPCSSVTHLHPFLWLQHTTHPCPSSVCSPYSSHSAPARADIAIPTLLHAIAPGPPPSTSSSPSPSSASSAPSLLSPSALAPVRSHTPRHLVSFRGVHLGPSPVSSTTLVRVSSLSLLYSRRLIHHPVPPYCTRPLLLVSPPTSVPKGRCRQSEKSRSTCAKRMDTHSGRC